MLSRFIRYFDLQSENRPVAADGRDLRPHDVASLEHGLETMQSGGAAPRFRRILVTDGSETHAAPVASPMPGQGDSRPRHAPVIPQYLAVSAGVFVEHLLRKYIDTGVWQLEWSALLGRMVFGLIIGIIILPAVYKSSFDPQKPVLVQLAALFPLGIGWQSLFTTATKLTMG
jgi:hypothetical protein